MHMTSFVESPEFVEQILVPWYGGSWVAYAKMRVNLFPDIPIDVMYYIRYKDLFNHIPLATEVTYSDQVVSY